MGTNNNNKNTSKKCRNKERRREMWDKVKDETCESVVAWRNLHPGQEVTETFKQELHGQVKEALLNGLKKIESEDPKPIDEQAQGLAAHAIKTIKTTYAFPVKRSEEEWREIFPRYPESGHGDGFLRAYSHGDADGIRDALVKYGLCVVDNVLTASDCDESITAMFDEVNSRRAELGITGPIVSPTNPESWTKHNWPSSRKFLLERPAFHPIAFRNRCNPKIQQIFTGIFGCDDLHVTIDNWGIIRGAKSNPKFPKSGLKPHWDINPWCWLKHMDKGNDPGYQGLVAFNDQTLETGCHLTLPGCTRFVRQWCRENVWPKSVCKGSYKVEPDDPCIKYMQPIPLRKGQMIVWSWGQMHGSTDNHSKEMRLSQFIRLYPAPSTNPGYDYEGSDRYGCNRIIRTYVRKGVFTRSSLRSLVTDESSQRLFGLDVFEGDEPEVEDLSEE